MILGAVIAGGRSSRFGADKAMAPFAGRPLIDAVIAALEPEVDALVVCGRRHGAWPCLADRPAPGLGPLGGVAAALRHAQEIGATAVLTVPCDTPGIAPATLATLRAQPTAAFVADCPIVALWPAALAERLEHFIASDPQRAIRGWARAVGAIALTLPVPANINTPADLAALADRMRRPDDAQTR